MGKEVVATKLCHQLGIFFAILLFTLVPVLAGTEYQEGIHLIRPDSQYITSEYVRPQYLTSEDITFVSCLEENYPLRNSLLCLDDNRFVDLEASKWSQSDNCYISSYNLEDFECEQLVVQAEYTKDSENIRMTKTVRVNKLSKVLDRILDTQYSDGGWKDPLSTAYGVWALSYFKDIYDYELDLAMDWLKLARNEDKKCWPKAPCNIETSSNILALLTMSNYTDARRVVNDARNWFEELQNDYTQGDEWTISIQAVSDNTTLSLVAYGTELLDENFTLPLNGVKNYSFNAYQGRKITIIADENVQANFTNKEGELLITYQGDNLSYFVSGACWSLNLKGEPCNTRSSLFALVTPIDSDQKDLAKAWARTEIEDGEILGTYIGDEDSPIDTSLFVYNLYSDDNNERYMDQAIDWLLYTQNNEGSWESGSTEEKMIPSAYAVLALIEAGYNRTSEPVEDAEEWASNNEDNISSENTQALSSAFYILRHNARPLLVSQPKIIVMDKPFIDIELYNPTTFDLRELTYEFSSNIEDALTIENKEEIDAYSYRKLTISRTDQSKQDVYGFLTVKNLDDPVAKIPVILTDTPVINVTTVESMAVFGRSANIPLQVQKTPHEFVCTMNWATSGISTPGSVKIKGNTDLPIQFDQSLTKEDVYEGVLTCAAAGKSTQIPLSLYLQRYAAKPLTIDPTDILVNSTGKDVVIYLQNNLDRDLSVSVNLDRYGNYFGYRPLVQLDPNEYYNFTLTNNLPMDINLTSSVLVEFTVLNRTEVVSMLVDVQAKPEQSASLWPLIIKLLVLLIVVGGLAFVVWKFRDVIFAELNKLTFWRIREEKRKESTKIKVLKEEEQIQAIVNVYKIMKLRDKDDKEIANKLLDSFEREDIRKALESVGAALPVLDEEAPGRVESS